MKHFLLLPSFCLAFSFVAKTQTALTKQETVTYIQNKMDEALKSNFMETGDPLYHYCWQETILLEGTGITVFHSVNNSSEEFGSYSTHWTYAHGNTRFYSCGYKKYLSTMKFNPANIVDIFPDPSVDNSRPVGRMKIILSSKTVKANVKTIGTWGKEDMGCTELGQVNNNDSMEDVFYVYYLQAEPTNFNKLKKAFEHLRDLFKAEDDPFGN